MSSRLWSLLCAGLLAAGCRHAPLPWTPPTPAQARLGTGAPPVEAATGAPLVALTDTFTDAVEVYPVGGFAAQAILHAVLAGRALTAQLYLGQGAQLFQGLEPSQQGAQGPQDRFAASIVQLRDELGDELRELQEYVALRDGALVYVRRARFARVPDARRVELTLSPGDGPASFRSLVVLPSASELQIRAAAQSAGAR